MRERVEAGDLAGAASAWEAAVGERGATYFARETGEGRGGHADVLDDEGYQGVAAAVITAAVHGRPARLILDTVNRGAISTLHDADVVEVSSIASRDGAEALPQGDLPVHAERLLDRVKSYERLTVEAAVTGSLAAAREALATHPLVGSEELARSLLDRFVEAHGTDWPSLA